MSPVVAAGWCNGSSSISACCRESAEADPAECKGRYGTVIENLEQSHSERYNKPLQEKEECPLGKLLKPSASIRLSLWVQMEEFTKVHRMLIS